MTSHSETTSFSTLRQRVRWLRERECDPRRQRDIRDAVLAWQDQTGELAPYDLGVMCSCYACGCTAVATTRCADSGDAVCEECREYTTTADGEVRCARCSDTEIVHDGNHSYLRLSPPEMPEEDQGGEYALYWDTAMGDSGVVARFATRELADQAVAAKDWPGPADHTDYLCGYGVRRWDGERWARES